VVGARAHEGEVAPVRIPATDAVAAAVGGEPHWRGDRPARRRYRVVKCMDAVARFDWPQGPDALVESPRFLEVRDHELDAADTAHPTLLHRRHPSGRAGAARESKCGETPASQS